MRTTVNIPDNILIALKKYTQAKTQTEAINKALKDFLRRARSTQLVELRGSFQDFMTQKDLKELRK